jgi:hypothetical protein
VAEVEKPRQTFRDGVAYWRVPPPEHPRMEKRGKDRGEAKRQKRRPGKRG